MWVEKLFRSHVHLVHHWWIFTNLTCLPILFSDKAHAGNFPIMLILSIKKFQPCRKYFGISQILRYFALWLVKKTGATFFNHLHSKLKFHASMSLVFFSRFKQLTCFYFELSLVFLRQIPVSSLAVVIYLGLVLRLSIEIKDINFSFFLFLYFYVQYIHKGLAARNVRLGKNCIAKVANIGCFSAGCDKTFYEDIAKVGWNLIYLWGLLYL